MKKQTKNVIIVLGALASLATIVGFVMTLDKPAPPVINNTATTTGANSPAVNQAAGSVYNYKSPMPADK